jgi:UDP-N-acetylglucosamine--N-acetylmuramyl-(pentapeptide) pyrophosphoryl-undecaprenol N-acetylglucosamine transferase
LAGILYGISPIGLGHATRSLVIAGLLRQTGAEVSLFSGGRAAEFLREKEQVADIVSDSVPKVVGGKMKSAAIWYLRSWLALRGTRGRTEKLFDAIKPDLVVCDEEFSGLLVAEKRGIKRVFISDELELGFARTWLARKIEERVDRWYRRIQGMVDLLLIPDNGEDAGNRRYIEPIVRPVGKSRTDVLREHGLPEEGKVVLLSMSGSGIGGFLVGGTVRAVRDNSVQSAYLVVTGNRGDKVEGEGVYDLGVVWDNQNLVAAADLVISTAGKSTIDEAASSGTPIIAIPIRYHAEQERNAAALGYSYSDLGRLSELIGEKIGRRESPRVFRGAENASRLILSML